MKEIGKKFSFGDHHQIWLKLANELKSYLDEIHRERLAISE